MWSAESELRDLKAYIKLRSENPKVSVQKLIKEIENSIHIGCSGLHGIKKGDILQLNKDLNCSGFYKDTYVYAYQADDSRDYPIISLRSDGIGSTISVDRRDIRKA